MRPAKSTGKWHWLNTSLRNGLGFEQITPVKLPTMISLTDHGGRTRAGTVAPEAHGPWNHSLQGREDERSSYRDTPGTMSYEL